MKPTFYRVYSKCGQRQTYGKLEEHSDENISEMKKLGFTFEKGHKPPKNHPKLCFYENNFFQSADLEKDIV